MTNYYDEYDVTEESRYESMLVLLLLYPPALELELFSGIFKPDRVSTVQWTQFWTRPVVGPVADPKFLLTTRWRSRVTWTARDNLRSILN